MKKLITIPIIALIALTASQGERVNVAAEDFQLARPIKVEQNCSRQFSVPIEKYWNGLGARGSIRDDKGREWDGWALFDTGATYSTVRHPETLNGGDLVNNPINAKLSFADWVITESLVLSPSLRNKVGPRFVGDTEGQKGHQIATIGTSIMKKWSVRIDDDRMYFSNLNKACREDQLTAEGYIRIDTSGFYQLEGQQVEVNRTTVAPTIPTVWIEILGIQVPAQIDTGYQVKWGENFIQVNKPLMEKLATKLPSANKYGNFYIENGGLIYFTSKDYTKKVASVSKIFISPKDPTSGGIAEWTIPAAMISAPAFFNAFSTSELRADKKAIWVKTR